MAIREISYYPAEVLSKISEPVTEFDKGFRDLVDDMFETMYEFDGVGLAAPQVGISQRLIIVDTRQAPEEKVAFVNPRITETSGEEIGLEGCLSLPDLYAEVLCAASIRVEAADCDGDPVSIEASGFFARVIQHEIDHLDGKVFIDRLDPFERAARLTEYEALRTAAISAANGG